MPHFQIKLLEGKTEMQKQQLAAAVIKAAQEVIGYEEASYSVSIQDFTMEQWKQQVYPHDIMGQQEKLYKQPGYKM